MDRHHPVHLRRPLRLYRPSHYFHLERQILQPNEQAW